MGEHKDHLHVALRKLQASGAIEAAFLPPEPPQGFSKNERAGKLLGFRRTDITAFDQPAEMGYHCPVCVYPQMKRGHFDERLHWSEYDAFIWCSVCNVDYPSCMCLPSGSRRAIDTFLASCADAARLASREPEGYEAIAKELESFEVLKDHHRNRHRGTSVSLVQAAKALDDWFKNGVDTRPPGDLIQNLRAALYGGPTWEEERGRRE